MTNVNSIVTYGGTGDGAVYAWGNHAYRTYAEAERAMSTSAVIIAGHLMHYYGDN